MMCSDFFVAFGGAAGSWRLSARHPVKAPISVLAALTILGLAPASAQSGPSLAGSNVQVIIGFGPGGGYDLWGRAVARHLGKHLPGNPTVVPQNMPGAGGYLAANHIYNVAPRDGTAMALIEGSVGLGPITGATGARFDPLKFVWLGTPRRDTDVCIASNSAQTNIKTLNDLKEKELIVGATGVGAGTYSYPKALSALLGLKFKVIAGFLSSSDVLLAMERGEVGGICLSLDSVANQRPEWIRDKKVTILLQGGVVPHPALKDVPFVVDLAKNADDKAAIEFLYAGLGFSRPFIAPPGLSADRVKMVRDAFTNTMKDPDFIADAKRQKLEVDPVDGENLEILIRKIYTTPRPIVDKVAELTK
jgi:tripartite-type tricarboxylate transporter receptor subunit TctC